MSIIISVILMKLKKLNNRLRTAFISFSVFLLYCLTAFLILMPKTASAENTLSDIPYSSKIENFCLLMSCEELNRYCGIIFDFEENHATAILFSSKTAAEEYGLEYKRKIEYDKFAEINIIGRLGGIVIQTQNCYNEHNSLWEIDTRSRIFGSAAIELGNDPELRSAIAYSFFRTLFTANLSNEDLKYIISLCRTDISYVDFCRSYDDIRKIGKSINIVTE